MSWRGLRILLDLLRLQLSLETERPKAEVVASEGGTTFSLSSDRRSMAMAMAIG